MSREIFQKIGAARSILGGNHFKDGKGRAIVSKIECEQKTDGWVFVTEFLVQSAAKVRPDVEPNAPGTSASFVQMLDKHKSAAGNIKAFVLELLGYTEESLAAAAKAQNVSPGDLFTSTMDALCGPGQPGRGMAVDFETYRKITREKKLEITLCRWTHVAQTATEIAARRGEMDQKVAAQPAA